MSKVIIREFPLIHQPDSMDCGPACLSMISEYYGKRHTLEHLRENCFVGRDGVSLPGISCAAEGLLDLEPHSLKFCTALYFCYTCRLLSDNYIDGCS